MKNVKIIIAQAPEQPRSDLQGRFPITHLEAVLEQ